MIEAYHCPSTLRKLPQLEVRFKPEWKGLLGHGFGLVLWIGCLLRIRAALRARDDFHQQIGGVHYVPEHSEPSRGILLHERVHAWQATQHRLHGLRYLVSRRYRRHAEAQAYALEVALGLRSRSSGVRSLSHPIYAMGLTAGEAWLWLDAYVTRWKVDCPEVLTWTP